MLLLACRKPHGGTFVDAAHHVNYAVHMYACYSLQVDQLYKQAAAALKLPEDKFKLVQKGTTITNSAAAAASRLVGSNAAAVSSSSSGGAGLSGARQRPSAVVHLSAGGERGQAAASMPVYHCQVSQLHLCQQQPAFKLQLLCLICKHNWARLTCR